MNVDLGRVVKFYHVAEGKSFIRAAEKLNVDQTWLSRQIQQLEAQLGCQLLERTTRHVTLTRQGEELFGAAKELAEASDRTRSVAYAIEQKKSRELRLGISNSTFWLPAREKLIEGFRSRHPDMVITTLVQNSTELIDRLRERSVDIAITGVVKDHDDFEYLTIYRSRPYLFVPSEHRLASIDMVTMSDIQGLDLVIPVIDNSYSFKAIYQPFLDAGAVPSWSAQGVYAAMHFAVANRVCMVAWGFENTVCDSFVLRDVVDCDAAIEVMAARNKGDERRSVRTFWATAHLNR